MRPLTLLLLCSTVANAQSISGTLAGSFTSFNSGKPTVHVDLELMCTLSCPASAPVLHYGVNGGVNATYASAPMESVGYFDSGVGTMASNVEDNTSFPPGCAFTMLAKSATCWCGGITGQGGFVDIPSSTVVVPPYVAAPGSLQPTVGKEWYQFINANLRGTETVDVHVSGGGLEMTTTLTASDFSSGGTGQVKLTPTQTGMMTVTATLQPYGASFSQAMMVLPGSGGTGGGSGGGSASTGGGSNNGGGQMPSGGCGATGGGSLLPLALLMWRKRARRAATSPAASADRSARARR